MVTGLDIHYDVGPGDHPLLGRRLPDVELSGDFGTSGRTNAFALLHGGHGVVLDLSGDDTVRAAAAPWTDRIGVVTAALPPDGPLAGVEAALVRPDGYFAWSGSGGSGAAGLAGALARWFGQPNDSYLARTPAVAGARP
jgi:bifunctional hydroxylase/dehydrase